MGLAPSVFLMDIHNPLKSGDGDLFILCVIPLTKESDTEWLNQKSVYVIQSLAYTTVVRTRPSISFLVYELVIPGSTFLSLLCGCSQLWITCFICK